MNCYYSNYSFLNDLLTTVRGQALQAGRAIEESDLEKRVHLLAIQQLRINKNYLPPERQKVLDAQVLSTEEIDQIWREILPQKDLLLVRHFNFFKRNLNKQGEFRFLDPNFVPEISPSLSIPEQAERIREWIREDKPSTDTIPSLWMRMRLGKMIPTEFVGLPNVPERISLKFIEASFQQPDLRDILLDTTLLENLNWEQLPISDDFLCKLLHAFCGERKWTKIVSAILRSPNQQAKLLRIFNAGLVSPSQSPIWGEILMEASRQGLTQLVQSILSLYKENGYSAYYLSQVLDIGLNVQSEKIVKAALQAIPDFSQIYLCQFLNQAITRGLADIVKSMFLHSTSLDATDLGEALNKALANNLGEVAKAVLEVNLGKSERNKMGLFHLVRALEKAERNNLKEVAEKIKAEISKTKSIKMPPLFI